MPRMGYGGTLQAGAYLQAVAVTYQLKGPKPLPPHGLP